MAGAPRQSCWPARAPLRSAIGKMLLAEAPWRLRCCWQDAAGREDARLHREAAAGRGAAEQDAAGKEDARLHREAAAGRGCLNGPLLL